MIITITTDINIGFPTAVAAKRDLRKLIIFKRYVGFPSKLNIIIVRW